MDRAEALHALDSYCQRESARPVVKTEQRRISAELVTSASSGSGLRAELSHGRAIVVEAGFDAFRRKGTVSGLNGESNFVMGATTWIYARAGPAGMRIGMRN